MKKNILLGISVLFLFVACNFGLDVPNAKETTAGNTGKHKRTTTTNESFIDETLSRDKTAIQGNFIVKTHNSFDGCLFEKYGFTVSGKIAVYDEPYIFWNVRNINGSLKQLSRIDGVILADYNRRVDAPVYQRARKLTKNGNPILRGITDGELDYVDQARGYSQQITHAVDAYKEYRYGEKTVYIGIIDTGINMKHKDFEDIVLYAKSCSTGAPSVEHAIPVAMDEPFTEIPMGENWDAEGHGTHCSGTMCAKGENADGSIFDGGINGVAWKNTKLISYQALGNAGGGDDWSIFGSLLDLINTVQILRKVPNTRSDSEKSFLPKCLDGGGSIQITQKTVPVNMSFGKPFAGAFDFYVMTKAIENDILPVAAMGNEGAFTSSYPAAYPGLISVGATDGENMLAPFSTRGSWISICAPGLGIESCINDESNGTINMSGTSMATPFVTGTIGYLLSFPNAHQLSPYQIKTLLEETAEKINAGDSSWTKRENRDWSDKYGYGRVNVYEAAKRISENNLPPENKVYSNAKFTVKVRNKGVDTGFVPSFQLLEKSSGIPILNIGQSAEKEVKSFYLTGLKKGVEYTIRAKFLGKSSEKTFMVGEMDETVNIDFDVNVIWISTVPNLEYNEGKDKTDTLISVYKANANGTVDPDEDEPIINQYDFDELDTTFFEYESGAEYYVLVEAFKNPATQQFSTGNYAIKIGSGPLKKEGENVQDTGRLKPEDNDSHEDDNTPTDAQLKGDAFNQTYGCNLVLVKNAGIGNDEIDSDWFYVKAPSTP